MSLVLSGLSEKAPGSSGISEKAPGSSGISGESTEPFEISGESLGPSGPSGESPVLCSVSLWPCLCPCSCSVEQGSPHSPADPPELGLVWA